MDPPLIFAFQCAECYVLGALWLGQGMSHFDHVNPRVDGRSFQREIW